MRKFAAILASNTADVRTCIVSELADMHKYFLSPADLHSAYWSYSRMLRELALFAAVLVISAAARAYDVEVVRTYILSVTSSANLRAIPPL